MDQASTHLNLYTLSSKLTFFSKSSKSISNSLSIKPLKLIFQGLVFNLLAALLIFFIVPNS